MVFPPPAPHAQRGAEAWLKPILARLELHGEAPWRVRVVAHGMAGVADAIRWLGADAWVATDVPELEAAPTGARVLYVFREEDAADLNFARDRIKARGLQVLMWVQEPLVWAQRRTAPDFDHWLLGEVSGPTAPDEVVRQLCGRDQVSWFAGDLDAALDTFALPRITQTVSGTAFSVLMDAALQPGVKLWREVRSELDAVAATMAQAGAEGPFVWVKPGVEVAAAPAGSVVVDPHTAQALLRRGGLPAGSAVGALLGFEAGAIDLYLRLPAAQRPGLWGEDPIADVIRAAAAAGLTPGPEALGSWARVTGVVPAPKRGTTLAPQWALAERATRGLDAEVVAEARRLGLAEVAQVWGRHLGPAPSVESTPPTWDVFLAYASGDRAIAQAVYAALNDAVLAPGRRARVFFDAARLHLGDPWVQLLPKAQAASTVTVVLVSKRADEAWYQRDEIAAAIELARTDARRVIPVYLDTTQPPYGLRVVHALTEADPAKIATALVSTLKRLHAAGKLPDLQPVEPEPDTRTAPARGEPMQARQFIGRADDLAALHAAMAAAPGVVVVEGMPGVGKSWLVDEWLRLHPRPVRTVVLTGGEDARHLLDRVADAGVAPGPAPLAERLNTELAATGAMVRVENVDTADQCAALAELADSLPDVALLATARFTGSEASPRWQKLPLDPPARAEAVAMLRARVPALTPGDAAQVAAAVYDLPLALDLAAGWLRKGRPVKAWLTALRDRSHTLGPAAPNLPGQVGRTERTLEAALGLAAQALREDGGPAEFTALGALPLAPAPTELVAAALGVDADAGWTAARHVADHGLLRAVGSDWLLHGVVRDWLRAQAGVGNEAAQARVDAWFQAQLEEGDEETRGARWTDMAKRPGLVAAWVGETAEDLTPLFEYARTNGPFLAWRDAFGRDTTVWPALRAAELAQRAGEPDDALRRLASIAYGNDVAAAAGGAGLLADILTRRGELDAALHVRVERQLPVYERLGDARERASTLGQIADIHMVRGEIDVALRILSDELLPTFERVGDIRSRAVTLGRIADMLGARGELDEALRIRTEEQLPVYERLGDVRSRAVTLGKIADIYTARGQLDEALRIRTEEQLPVYERLGDVRSRAVTLGKIADIHMALGQLDDALRIRTQDELPIYLHLRDRREILICRANLAVALALRAHPEDRPEIQNLLAQALHAARDMRLPEAARLEDLQRRLNLPVGETRPD